MNTPSYRLVMRTGPTPNAVFDLKQAEVSIGRETSNAISVSDTEISRRHARLNQQAGSFLLTDLGSTNGTFVNGKRLLSPHLLRPGETITLGQNVSFVFEAVAVDLDATLITPVGMPAPPPEPAPMPSPTPAPVPYSRQVPEARQPVQAKPYVPPPQAEPAEAEPVYQEEPRRRVDSRWVLAGVGCLVIVLCVILTAFLLWVDSGGVDRWCQFFGFLFPACP